MAISTAFDQFETIIHENMGEVVVDMQLPDVDDPAESYIASMEDLGPGGRPESGDGWEASRRIKLSRGGMITGGQWGGNAIEALGASDVLPIGQRATAKAPDPERVPLTQYAKLKVKLKRILGNVVVNMSQILADLAGDDLEEVAVGHMEDAAYQVRKHRLAWFYGAGDAVLAESAETMTIDGTAGGISLAIQAGTFNRFVKSQRYMFYTGSTWDPGTTTTRKGGIARCVNIDDNIGEVLLEMEEGEADASLVKGDKIVLAETMTTGSSGVALVPHGIENMFAKTGEFYGLAARENFPELVSYVEGDESAVIDPEPDRLAVVLDKLHNAGQLPPDMLVSEKSLRSQYAYLEKAGYATYVVPGYMPNPNGGVGAPTFSHEDVFLPWESSAYIRPGMIWGAARGTVLRFQPGGADNIRWWNANGPGAGISGIFNPVNDGTRQTELWQAPFETHCEYMAIKPKRNIRYLGLRPLSAT